MVAIFKQLSDLSTPPPVMSELGIKKHKDLKFYLPTSAEQIADRLKQEAHPSGYKSLSQNKIERLDNSEIRQLLGWTKGTPLTFSTPFDLFEKDIDLIDDDTSDKIGLKQINTSEALAWKVLFKSIESGKTTIQIKGTDEFKKEMLSCIKKLLQRPSGRSLILLILKQDDPLNIEYQDASNFFDCNCMTIKMDLQNPTFYYALSTDGKKYRSRHKNHVLLAHEMLHALLYYCSRETFCYLRDTAASIAEYDNLNEQLVITGGDGIFPCENTIRKEFDELERFWHDSPSSSLVKSQLNGSHLQITSPDITDDEFIDLIKTYKGKAITSIDISGCSYITNAALAHLKGLALTDLNVSDCYKISDAGLAHLKGIPLTKLNLKGCSNITDDGLAYLKGMPLTELNLEGRKKITDAGLAHLKGMPLTHLNISGRNKITDAGLAHLKGMPLTHLDLSRGNITDAGLAHLKGLPLTSLKLNMCEITDTGLIRLKGMPLNYLDVSDCYITDDALVHLKEMPLNNLNVRFCKFTAAGLEDLKKMKLQFLDA